MSALLENLVVPSPIQTVNHPLLASEGINLAVKREDLIHPYVSGNKWRKLKYNLLRAREEGTKTIVTFGGAFSNHIHAIAVACKLTKLQSIGIIRGEYDSANPTLQFARSCGMELFFIDRQSYREKEKSTVVKEFLEGLESYTIVPEGGTNELAFEGLEELAHEINCKNHHVVMVSAGTGGTATGILQALDISKELWVYSSLKSDYLKQEISSKVTSEKSDQFRFLSDYHYGGYGKSPATLISFINDFQNHAQIPLDPIYNAKLIAGFFDMIRSETLDKSKSYLWIHTGGLQGAMAYNYMAAKKGKDLIEIDV